MENGQRFDERWACYAERLFDGERVLEQTALIIDGERIAEVAPLSKLPPEMPAVTAPGGTVLPGLIDVHVHFGAWQGPLYLAHGVTTVRDVGNYPEWILARQVEARNHPWPHISCVGPILDGPNPSWGMCRPCVDEESARRAVAETAALGVNGIKLYVGLASAWLPAMVDAARAADLPVMMHTFDLPGALDAGVEEFFHLDGLLDALWPGRPPGWLGVWGHEDFPRESARLPQLADHIAASGIITTPTLFYWDFAWHMRRVGRPEPAEEPYLPEKNLTWLRAVSGQHYDPDAAEVWGRACRNAYAFLALLIERKAPILTGTDEPWGLLLPGQSLWREMELLVECGMKPADALRAATADAAKRLRLPDRGRLRPGAVADLMLVAGDPTMTLTAHPDIVATVRGGCLYRPAELKAGSLDYARNIEHEPMGIEFKAKASR